MYSSNSSSFEWSAAQQQPVQQQNAQQFDISQQQQFYSTIQSTPIDIASSFYIPQSKFYTQYDYQQQQQIGQPIISSSYSSNTQNNGYHSSSSSVSSHFSPRLSPKTGHPPVFTASDPSPSPSFNSSVQHSPYSEAPQPPPTPLSTTCDVVKVESSNSLIASASNVINIITSIGKILYSSPSVESMLGYSQNSLSSTSYLDYIHPDDLSDFMTTLSESISKGSIFNMIYRFKTGAGSFMAFSVEGKPFTEDLLNKKDLLSYIDTFIKEPITASTKKTFSGLVLVARPESSPTLTPRNLAKRNSLWERRKAKHAEETNFSIVIPPTVETSPGQPIAEPCSSATSTTSSIHSIHSSISDCAYPPLPSSGSSSHLQSPHYFFSDDEAPIHNPASPTIITANSFANLNSSSTSLASIGLSVGSGLSAPASPTTTNFVPAHSFNFEDDLTEQPRVPVTFDCFDDTVTKQDTLLPHMFNIQYDQRQTQQTLDQTQLQQIPQSVQEIPQQSSQQISQQMSQPVPQSVPQSVHQQVPQQVSQLVPQHISQQIQPIPQQMQQVQPISQQLSQTLSQQQPQSVPQSLSQPMAQSLPQQTIHVSMQQSQPIVSQYSIPDFYLDPNKISASSQQAVVDMYNMATIQQMQLMGQQTLPTSTYPAFTASASTAAAPIGHPFYDQLMSAGFYVGQQIPGRQMRLTKRKSRYGNIGPGGGPGYSGHVCTECHAVESPEWRKGPKGPKTLCNACGLRWAKKSRRESEKLKKAAALAAAAAAAAVGGGSDRLRSSVSSSSSISSSGF